jgi:hypothetical protein
VVWRKELPAAISPNAAGVSADGSYWIAGTLFSFASDSGREVDSGARDFSQRIGADGVVAAPVVLSENDKGRHFFCAVRRGDDTIQTDTDSSRDEYLHLTVPRVSMSDAAGKLLWERYIAFDQGRRISHDQSTFSNPNNQLFDCAGIIATQSGRILAALRADVFPALNSDDEARQELARGSRGLRPATLLVALDLEGHELASVRHDNTAAALLVDSPAGARLFETVHSRVGTPEFTLAGQFLRLFTFDADLREIKPPITFEDSNFDTVNAAFPTPEGGLLIKGCPDDDENRYEYLRYIAPSGAISPKRHLTELGFVCGGLFSLSTRVKGEALLLVQTPQQGNRLLSLKYSD